MNAKSSVGKMFKLLSLFEWGACFFFVVCALSPSVASLSSCRGGAVCCRCLDDDGLTHVKHFLSG